jgi:diadenylate cyclase
MAADATAASKAGRDIEKASAKSQIHLSDVLRRVAPGTGLREALDNVISANGGALIVIGDTAAVAKLCDGGFALCVPFSPQRLFELTKMDGAILLDDECRTILRANVHLVPDPGLPTAETGMRHRTAERVSRQTAALVVSVSQRRNMVSIYRNGRRLTLQDVTVVLAKANQALQTLQRYRAGLDEVLGRLTLLEFEDAATVGDVVTAVRRSELVQRVSREVARYVGELGSEGRLVAMQAEEMTANVAEDHVLLVRDYNASPGLRDATIARTELSQLTSDELADDFAVAGCLGLPTSPDAMELNAKSRGYRVLRRIPSLPASVVNRLVERFAALASISRATEEQLDEVDGVGARRARAIADGLRRLREANRS